MTLEIMADTYRRELEFPIMLRQMTEEETKEYHLRKLYELSVKLLGRIPWLDEPSGEQKSWILFRLSHPQTWPKIRENRIGDWKNWK